MTVKADFPRTTWFWISWMLAMPGVTARHSGRASADPHGQDRTLVAGEAGLGESSRPVESRLTYFKPRPSSSCRTTSSRLKLAAY